MLFDTRDHAGDAYADRPGVTAVRLGLAAGEDGGGGRRGRPLDTDQLRARHKPGTARRPLSDEGNERGPVIDHPPGMAAGSSEGGPGVVGRIGHRDRAGGRDCQSFAKARSSLHHVALAKLIPRSRPSNVYPGIAGYGCPGRSRPWSPHVLLMVQVIRTAWLNDGSAIVQRPDRIGSRPGLRHPPWRGRDQRVRARMS